MTRSAVVRSFYGHFGWMGIVAMAGIPPAIVASLVLHEWMDAFLVLCVGLTLMLEFQRRSANKIAETKRLVAIAICERLALQGRDLGDASPEELKAIRDGLTS